MHPCHKVDGEWLTYKGHNSLCSLDNPCSERVNQASLHVLSSVTGSVYQFLSSFGV